MHELVMGQQGNRFNHLFFKGSADPPGSGRDRQKSIIVSTPVAQPAAMNIKNTARHNNCLDSRRFKPPGAGRIRLWNTTVSWTQIKEWVLYLKGDYLLATGIGERHGNPFPGIKALPDQPPGINLTSKIDIGEDRLDAEKRFNHPEFFTDDPTFTHPVNLRNFISGAEYIAP